MADPYRGPGTPLMGAEAIDGGAAWDALGNTTKKGTFNCGVFPWRGQGAEWVCQGLSGMKRRSVPILYRQGGVLEKPEGGHE